MNPKKDFSALVHALTRGLARHNPDSKHAPGRVSAIRAYRAKRQQKNRAAHAMRKVQRRLDRQSSKRQRSGRRR
jgi:hypothetical protein